MTLQNTQSHSDIPLLPLPQKTYKNCTPYNLQSFTIENFEEQTGKKAPPIMNIILPFAAVGAACYLLAQSVASLVATAINIVAILPIKLLISG